jgi:hypothetical protein
MSVPCTTISPSHESAGPGGPVVAFAWARSCASVASGPSAVSRATFFAAIASNRNPDPASRPKNVTGVSFAVATTWPSTSWTVHPRHSEGVDHAASGTAARSSASAARSRWISGQGLASGIGPPSGDP